MQFQKKSNLFSSPVFWYLAGLLLITVLFYYFIGRFSGYIFYWDLSGAFSVRQPFDQYLFTYTPYDGIEVGLKNRLPIVSIIWAITKTLSFFGGSPGELAIKVSVWCMFVGAFSVFYMLLPRWQHLFVSDHSKKPAAMPNLLRLFFSLLYIILPFYSYRLNQLHLFFFTTFYPLVIFFFLKLLFADKKSWKKWGLCFITTMFFGLTTPHSILYYGLTLGVLFLFWLSSTQYKEKMATIGRIALVGVGVLSTNLYWLVPYMIEKSPTPGYVVSTDMITFLAQNSTVTKYLLDMSEWFLGEGPNLSAIVSGSAIAAVQYIGIASLYVFALMYIFNHIKASAMIKAAVTLLLISLLLGLPSLPGISAIYSTFIFSKFGWIIREPNRIRFIFTFWSYLLFVLGIWEYFTKNKKPHPAAPKPKFDVWSVYLIFAVSLLSLVFYAVPVFYTYLGFLKPTIMSSAFTEVQQQLSENSWGGVLLYPGKAGYAIHWKEPTLVSADDTNALFLPYNLNVPSVQQSGVLANGQSVANTVGSLSVAGDMTFSASTMQSVGIQYVLVTKYSIPLLEQFPDLSKQIEQKITALKKEPGLKIKAENSEYILFEVQKNDPDKLFQTEQLVTPEDVRILDKIALANSQIVFSNHGPDTYTLQDTKKKILVYSDNPLVYLDFLPNETRKKYSVDLYASVKRYSLDISWGRMSLLDKVNGSAQEIFSQYGIKNHEYDSLDEIIYSDTSFFHKPVTPLQVVANNQCVAACDIYVKVLRNSQGGKLHITVGNKTYDVNAVFSRDTYQWIKLDSNVTFSSNTNVTVAVESGFQSIAGLLLLPSTDSAIQAQLWQKQNVIRIDPLAKKQITVTAANSSCLATVSQKSFLGISVYDLSADCATPVFLDFGNWKGSSAVFVSNDSGRWTFLDTQKPFSGIWQGSVYLVTFSTLVLWALFIPTIFVVYWGLLYLIVRYEVLHSKKA